MGGKKLSEEELKKMLEELKITAKYWEEHKDELMAQAGSWMKSKSFTRTEPTEQSKKTAKTKKTKKTKK